MPRPVRRCPQPGCDEKVPCATHQQARANTTDRGYGAEHRREREKWLPLVLTGKVRCARCGGNIAAGQRWHLDHNDAGTGYLGPSHAGCNTATKRHAKQRRRST